MNKKQKPRDRHLDVPAEANRDKHINFTARERSEADQATESNGALFRKANKELKKTKQKHGLNNER